MTATARFASALLLAAQVAVLSAGSAHAAPAYLVDGDGDAVSDEIDECPYTQPGVQVNRLGCPLRQEDGDADGVADEADQCPYTAPGAQVDAQGCAMDSDFDGVANGIDRCPNTPLAAVVNERGCAVGERATAVATLRVPAEVPARVVLGPIPPRPEVAATPVIAPAAAAAFKAEEPALVINFRPGSARLGRGDLALIKAYAKVFSRRLAANPARKLEVAAVADHRELEPESVLLARANAVRAALLAEGLPDARLTSRNSLRNTGEAGANRRVEITLGVL